MADFDRESMMEMFNFEMSQLLEQLEQNTLQGESGYTMDKINEIFRIMHTIKGSAAMMLFENIAMVAHAIEDLFFYLREENPQDLDYSTLTDFILEGADFIKGEITKLESNLEADGDPVETSLKIKNYLLTIKSGAKSGEPKGAASEAKQSGEPKTSVSALKGIHSYLAKVDFIDGCEMENVRAFTLVNNLLPVTIDISCEPKDLMDEANIQVIRKNGLLLKFTSELQYDEIYEKLNSTIYLRNLELTEQDGGFQPLKLSIFDVVIRFEEGAEMENVRAFTVVHNLKGKVETVTTVPEDLIDEAATDIIKKDGFHMTITTEKDYDQVMSMLNDTLFLKELIVSERKDSDEMSLATPPPATASEKSRSAAAVPEAPRQINQQGAASDNGTKAQTQKTDDSAKKTPTQHVISVNVTKLDTLLKLMGELVIAEAMVAQNPELDGLELESFHKEARQLRKTINDLQETVMSMRMVPLSTTFFKMHRIVRDMCKQLNKEVTLNIVGEETEVDKNIIEHISDPLMHIIRNSVDHGIEMPEVRERNGKDREGVVTLEAKNSGSDVLITVRDDGAGMNKEKILEKAKANGLLRKPEAEHTDRDIYQYVFMPGFSTNDEVTSFSGRGVGMDVVIKNLELIRGTVLVDSTPGEGSTFTLKIPLTLAIVNGMTVMMGGSKYTIPITAIKDSFRPKLSDVFKDPDGNEMITVRGECYNIVRLYEFFGIEPKVKNLEDGIMMMVEDGDDTLCLLVDELVGEQQVVVKPMPRYIKKIDGISGCTLLGNGDISLIIEVAGFFDR